MSVLGHVVANIEFTNRVIFVIASGASVNAECFTRSHAYSRIHAFANASQIREHDTLRPFLKPLAPGPVPAAAPIGSRVTGIGVHPPPRPAHIPARTTARTPAIFLRPARRSPARRCAGTLAVPSNTRPLSRPRHPPPFPTTRTAQVVSGARQRKVEAGNERCTAYE